ncbi:hypothetical protein BLA6860_02446 [Burkholderia lata]|nr:hypothetical protein BLA6860_02446 [Burkholderia lata]
MTPLMIVSSCEPTIDAVRMIGSRFAGMYRIAAASSSAHVRIRLFGVRKWRTLPQRAQWACGWSSVCTSPHAWQLA